VALGGVTGTRMAELCLAGVRLCRAGHLNGPPGLDFGRDILGSLTGGSRRSSRRELDDPRASNPCQMQVLVVGVAVLIHVNPGEAGECRIRDRHVCVCRDDVGLSDQSLDVCHPDLSLEPEGRRLACPKVSDPAGTGADEEVGPWAR